MSNHMDELHRKTINYLTKNYESNENVNQLGK